MNKAALWIFLLVATLAFAPGTTRALEQDDAHTWTVSQTWDGQLSSPILELFLSNFNGQGAAGFLAFLERLRNCACPGVAVPEPATALLTGLFLTLGCTTRRRQVGTGAA